MPIKHLVIREYQRVNRRVLGATLLAKLQAFDESQARHSSERVFDWSLLRDFRALNYVGVVQVPGLIVEILPKIDDTDNDDRLAQRNLLYMLAFTRKLPIRVRDLASLSTQQMPLMELLIRLFADRLIKQLRCGVDHQYLYRKENARFLRGKLLVGEHVRRNAAHRERLYVGYEEFLSDTWLNRILKAACRKLVRTTTSIATEQRLRESVLLLAEAEDRTILGNDFERVHFSRNNERYRELFDFAKLVLIGQSPAPRIGREKTFSLLFPMDKLFEEFIVRFIMRYRRDLGLANASLYAQAAGCHKWLLKRESGNGYSRLKPDLLVDQRERDSKLILDTKWKPLDRQNVGMADLYQLYAYADRFDSAENILLYPKVAGATAQSYHLYRATRQRVRIEFVDMKRDLRSETDQLKRELRDILAS